MIWLTWRQFRIQVAAACAAVVLVAITLAATGPRLVRLARIDANIFDRLTPTDRNLFFAGIIVMALTPAVIGAFWGAPLVARELEAGTHRLVWNQSVTRTRWLATKLGVTALAGAAAAGALTLAITWWSKPIDGAVSTTHGSLPSRLTPVSFAMRGIAPVAYTVFAVVLGVALGVVLRRSLPAMAITLAVVTFVQIAAPLWVRPHLITPVHTRIAFSRATLDGIMADGSGGPVSVSLHTADRGDWILANESVDTAGHAVALPSWFGDCIAPSPPLSVSAGPVQAPDVEACLARLTREGYQQRVIYQPAGRFWALQWAETALFLVLSGLLTGFCFWWTRNRLA